ncbi:MAG: DedA family protein [Sphingomonas sp.]
MTDWMIRLIDWGGYAGVFGLMLLETMLPFIPSEVILPLAGLSAAHGPMSLPGVIVAATAGSMFGNYCWYMIARSVGRERFAGFVDRHGRWLTMDCRDLVKLERMFERYGGGIVFAARVLPGVRTFISLPAGFFGMPVWRYLFWSTAGTAIWSGLFAAAGYGVGASFGPINHIVGPITSATVLFFTLWYIWRQITWRRRRA